VLTRLSDARGRTVLSIALVSSLACEDLGYRLPVGYRYRYVKDVLSVRATNGIDWLGFENVVTRDALLRVSHDPNFDPHSISGLLA
jgi:hypothetical protein